MLGKQEHKHGSEGYSVLAPALKTGEDQWAEESTAATTSVLQSLLPAPLTLILFVLGLRNHILTMDLHFSHSLNIEYIENAFFFKQYKLVNWSVQHSSILLMVTTITNTNSTFIASSHFYLCPHKRNWFTAPSYWMKTSFPVNMHMCSPYASNVDNMGNKCHGLTKCSINVAKCGLRPICVQ